MSSKAILTVGYQQILLPDSAQAAKVLEILSKGVLCRDRLYDKSVQLSKDALDLELKIVPPGTRFMAPEGEPPEDVEVFIKKAPKRLNGHAVKRLPAQRTLFLGDSR